MKRKSMLFVRNHIPYLRGILNTFYNFTVPLIFTAAKLFHQVISERRSIKLCIHNDMKL